MLALAASCSREGDGVCASCWHELHSSGEEEEKVDVRKDWMKLAQMADVLMHACRACRQPEFSQLDMEMTFMDQEAIMGLAEGLVRAVFLEVSTALPACFLRLPPLHVKAQLACCW